MRIATVKFKSLSPYSASHVIESEKAAKEAFDDFEKRIWRERLNVDEQGQGIIPGMAFKLMLDTAVKRFGGKIKGRGQATWTKFFEAGVLVMDPLQLVGVTRENVQSETLFVPSDGVKGSGKRVWKTFPIVKEWSGEVNYLVLDDTITQDIFERMVTQAFAFVGIGRFRPERGGFLGRAEVVKINWRNE